MFDRKQYVNWLNQQQQMYNPHLRNLNTENSEVDDKNEPIDLQEGIGGIALGFGALGAATGLVRNLAAKRNPTSGKMVQPEKKKGLIGSALKGAAIGAGTLGAATYAKTMSPKIADSAKVHAKREAKRHLKIMGHPHEPEHVDLLADTPEFIKKGLSSARKKYARVGLEQLRRSYEKGIFDPRKLSTIKSVIASYNKK